MGPTTTDEAPVRFVVDDHISVVGGWEFPDVFGDWTRITGILPEGMAEVESDIGTVVLPISALRLVSAASRRRQSLMAATHWASFAHRLLQKHYRMIIALEHHCPTDIIEHHCPTDDQLVRRAAASGALYLGLGCSSCSSMRPTYEPQNHRS
jgi:hypothetical protein